MLLEGIPPKEIAHKLNISSHTVDTHRTSLYRKLGVKNIRELLAQHLPKSSVETPFTVTFTPNVPYGSAFQFYPFTSNNVRITAGDSYNFSCTFTSDADFEFFQVMFVDAADLVSVRLSPTLRVIENVKANIEYSGTITLIANKTAASAEPNANLIYLDAINRNKPELPPPTITFTRFELVKNNHNGFI